MGFYSSTALELLCRLIRRDNPQLAVPLDPNTVMVLSGPLTTGLGTSGRNTRVILNGRTGSGITGKKEFFYDRLNIGTFFNGITVVFEAEGSASTYADLLPSLNEQYGLGLTADDLANPTTVLPYGYSATTVTLNIASSSLAYTGKLDVTWTRKPVGIYPESGPGSKVLLIGSLNEGYFGVVSEEELFSPMAMLAALNEGQEIPAGSLYGLPTVRNWFKFARDGKIIYLANYSHMAISWQDLYVRGAVYETDVPEDQQYPTTDAHVPQRMVMRKREAGRDWYLSPCLPRLSTTDPWDPKAGPSPDPTGDIARLFSKIIIAGGVATGEWDGQTSETANFLYVNSAVDTTRAYGSNMVASSQSEDLKSANTRYRPMLELVNLDKMPVPLENFIGTPEGVLRKPLFSIEPDTGDILLTVSDIAWEIQGALNPPLTALMSEPPVTVTDIGWAQELRTPIVEGESSPPSVVTDIGWHQPNRTPTVTVTAEYTEVEPQNLADCNGELLGFK